MGGTNGLVGGILIAVYMFSGWDTSVYVNEETRDSRVNPGRAVLISVGTLTVMYAFFTFAYQGAVRRGALLAHGGNALTYIVRELAGSPWDKVMVVAVLFALFYAATGLGMAVYYRKLAVRSVRGFTELMVVPALSAAFLIWVAVKSVPGLGGWWSPVLKLAYLMIGIGVVLMIVARARHQTDYFSRPVEAYQPGQPD